MASESVVCCSTLVSFLRRLCLCCRRPEAQTPQKASSGSDAGGGETFPMAQGSCNNNICCPCVTTKIFTPLPPSGQSGTTVPITVQVGVGSGQSFNRETSPEPEPASEPGESLTLGSTPEDQFFDAQETLEPGVRDSSSV